MFDVKTIFKEFVQYSIGAMFLWFLSIIYELRRQVHNDKNGENRRNSRRMSKADSKKLTSKHRNSNSSEQDLNSDIKKKKRKKKSHNVQVSYGCWLVLVFPITLAIIGAFIPQEVYSSIFDEVWLRQKIHNLKIVFHEVVYRDPLSRFDWTNPNDTIIMDPIDQTVHLTFLSPQATTIGKKKVVPAEMTRTKKSLSNVR